MNRTKLAALLLTFGGSVSVAHAELMLKKGAKATLRVEYIYTSAGTHRPPSGEEIASWKARHVINITANYVADAPQPLGVMHPNDRQQQQDIQALQEKVTATHQKMQPGMADMMKIVTDCKEDEACISRRVSDYGNNMTLPSDTKATSAAIADMGRPGAARFQLWRLASQSGSYQIEERSERQIFELTCTTSRICKRTETTSGGGDIASPAGRSIAGASMLEVDGGRKDVVLTLPNALVPLYTEVKVETTIPNDTRVGGKRILKPLTLNAKPITATFPSDRLAATGTQTIKIAGDRIDGGTLTITWSLAAQ
jgi:hypothetical protein